MKRKTKNRNKEKIQIIDEGIFELFKKKLISDEVVRSFGFKTKRTNTVGIFNILKEHAIRYRLIKYCENEETNF